MKLVRLSSNCAINPRDVSNITVVDAHYQRHVEVRMMSGAVHLADIRYGETAWKAQERLVNAVEEALNGG